MELEPKVAGRRVNLWLAIACFAGSIVVALTMLHVADLPRNQDGGAWELRIKLLMALAGLLCMLGIWRLQRALHWTRRTWRGRALALLVLPFFCLPIWIASQALDHSFDANVLLREIDLPGYRVGLPDWHIQSKTLDFWSGFIRTRRRITGETISIRWQPGPLPADLPTLAALPQNQGLGENSQVAGVADEPMTVSGGYRPTHYTRTGSDGEWLVGFTVWACADDRTAMVTTVVPASFEHARIFHRRVLASISCTAAIAPPPIHASFQPPAGFKSAQRNSQGTLYVTADDDEEIFLSSGNHTSEPQELLQDATKRLSLALKFKPQVANATGAAENLTLHDSEADRTYMVQRIVLNEENTPGWLTLTAWRCPTNDLRFWALHLGSQPDEELGRTRLQHASCPK